MEKKKCQVECQLDQEWAALSVRGEMLKGSLSKVSLGKRKRAAGERAAWLLTWKDATGKTKTLYVSETELPGVRTMLANYKDARKRLDTIARMGLEIVKSRKTKQTRQSPPLA